MKLRPWVVAGCCWTFHSLVGQVPEIVVQPADIEARAGDPAGFFVSVQGSVTSYQWMRDAEPIEHSDRPYLFIPAATEEDSGTYTVHAEYSSGKLISEPATLGVFEGRAGIVDRAYTATLPIPSTLPPDWLLNSDHLEVFDNGTVWLAGYFGPWHQDYPRFTVVRPDGSPDEAFHDFSPIPGDGAISAITAGPDGGVFIGGFTDSDVGTSHFLAKVSQDGVADPGFPVQILPGPIRMIRIQDTRIIVGYIEGADPGLEFVRYSAEGLPDPAFLPEPDEIFDLIADAGGRLIVTNPERTMRLTDDGAIDTWLHRNQPMKDGSRLKLGADGMVYLLEHYFWRDSIGWTKSFYDQFGVFRLGESSHETTSVSRSQDFGYTNVDDPNPNSSPRPKDYSDSRDTRRRVPQVSFEVTGDGRPVLGGMDVSARGYNNRYNYDEESVHHHLVGYGPDTNVDPTFHAGLGADQNEGGIAVKRSPDGQFIFVFGNFQSFDDHPTSVLARVFAEPPHPYAVPPRILAVLPEAPDFPDGDPIICQILVAGSPPFSSESMIPGPNSGPGTLRVKIKYWPAINPYAKVVVWNRYGLNSLRQDVDDLISRTPTPPRFVRPPPAVVRLEPGQAATLHTRVEGTMPATFSWMLEGSTLQERSAYSGENTFTLPSDLESSVSFQCVVSNAVGEVSQTISVMVEEGLSRLTNLSIRADTLSGEGAVTAGSIATGSKTVIVRAIGPGLEPYGVSDFLQDPFCQVYAREGELTAWKDDAGGTNSFALRLGAFPLTNPAKDSVLALDLEPSAPKTVRVTGADGGVGTTLIEIYEYDEDWGRLVNFSSRAHIAGRQKPAILGLAIVGTNPLRLLFRAAGPALAEFGVKSPIQDPNLRIFDMKAQAVISENDDWMDNGRGPNLEEAFAQSGAFPFPNGSRDAAIVLELDPGLYTAVIEGENDTEGIGLLEVYELGNQGSHP